VGFQAKDGAISDKDDFTWIPTAEQYFSTLSFILKDPEFRQVAGRHEIALAQLKLTLATSSLISYHEWLIVCISRLVHERHPC